MIHKLYAISLLLFFLAYSNSLSASTDDILQSLSNEMSHYSEVATATNENEHYQPYVISVFKGKELEKLGVVNLEEALGLVPGVDMATDNMGIKTPIFRGSNPTSYGQSKLFIDGVPANNVFFDAYSEHLKMPVEMIKRIEVVRGPGSKTDGYNAYAGSINVITYAENFEGLQNGDSIVTKGGSYKYGMIGFVKSYDIANFRLSTDFSYQRDDKTAYAGPDGLSQGVFGPANVEYSKTGDAYLWFESYSLGATLNYQDKFFIKLRFLDHTQSSGYGINLNLSARESDRLKTPNHYIELGYEEKISKFTISIKSGVKYDSFDSVALLGDPGITLQGINLPDGSEGIHSADQRTLYQSTFLKYNGFEKHNINFGYRISQEKTMDIVSKLTASSTVLAAQDNSSDYAFFDEDAERNTQAVFLEDSYTFSKSFSFLFGLNYERTSYKDAGVEPKASVVYQQNMKNIYKLIYSKSHRNPSWQEMYTQNNHARVGSTEFEPERVEAYEAAYVYKIDSSSHLQSNIFYLKNSDQIQIVDSSTGEFGNTGDSTLYGLELEYKGYISSRDSVYLNYSYIGGEEDAGEELSNVASHMIKGYYSYDIIDELSSSFVFKHVGEKERVDSDSRDTLKAYTKIDLTTRYDNKRYNYTLMASVKNIFDSDIRFPSKPNTYTEDYIQEGRNFMITLKKEF